MSNPNQCYFNGDFYQCAVAATAGQSPQASPASWRKVQIPKEWRWALARLTHANLLKLDGQTDKAGVERGEAIQTERTGVEDLVRKEANREQWMERPAVGSRTACW